MVVRLVAAVVARGGTLTVEGDRLRCRLPTGTTLPAELAEALAARKAEVVAALAVAPLDRTTAYIRALAVDARAEYAAALAHDLAAFAGAEAMPNGSTDGDAR